MVEVSYEVNLKDNVLQQLRTTSPAYAILLDRVSIPQTNMP